MFFLKKKINPLNLFFSKKVRNALFFYNSKINKNLINIKKNEKIFVLEKKKLHDYFTELLCQLKKNKCKFKRKRTFRYLLLISRNALILKQNVFLIRTRKKKWRKRKSWIKEKYMDPIFTDSLINLLKVETKFQYVTKTGFKYCKLFFKYTGSNFFGTITDANGNVHFSYSSGIFSGLNTRKEKTTIFVVKHLGELLSLRLYKSNVGEIIFIPLINHRKIRTFLRFLIFGFREMKMMNFVKMIPKRKIMRNGVRLKKVARK